MPYIKGVQRRDDLRKGARPLTIGELDFVLTTKVLQYLEGYQPSFELYNSIVGALDNVKDEFRRRLLHKYEDEKCEENGDVFNGHL